MKKRAILTIVAFTVLVLLFSGFIHGAIPASERAALVALYKSTDGDHWMDNRGWKTPPLHTDGFAMPGTEGSWFGVILSGDNVTELWLEENQLGGSIPSQLGNLSQLKHILLYQNQLSGSIPSQLGNLSNLIFLELSGNNLSGSIPSQLGNLSNLEELRLSDNRLSGSIPSQLSNLSELDFLVLSNNQLSGSIPSQLGNLSSLNFLFLDNNQLKGVIPSSFINLTGIIFFDITYNCLSATDPALRAWLNYYDPDWEAHQDQCGSNLPEINPPFGSFETPMDGATVSGSIAITGWALDDGGLESVKIYLVQGNTPTYIGDALFVKGARPDVAAAYPEYPSNTKAGWGYMMLTNFLPGEGNGTFVLSVVATDLVGKTTELGTKTIIVDNAHAVKPFGTIDTPTQGGTATGSRSVNWGWVLTPQPNNIPTDGSTINVWVDGVNKGHPTYNIYRSDIAGFFPGYANSNGAVGYFYLDTRAYENGVHTIQWTVTDNANNTDGIGSRYFTIQNIGSDSAMNGCNQEISPDFLQISELPVDGSGPIKFYKGFNADNECQELLPDEKGESQIVIKELERVEIQLGENHADIQGWVMSQNELHQLPIGSTLDARSGTFSWSPGPGFLGRYSFVFVLTDSNGQSFKKCIEIKIEPKFNGMQ